MRTSWARRRAATSSEPVFIQEVEIRVFAAKTQVFQMKKPAGFFIGQFFSRLGNLGLNFCNFEENRSNWPPPQNLSLHLFL
jgi:hypothetical protein